MPKSHIRAAIAKELFARDFSPKEVADRLRYKNVKTLFRLLNRVNKG